MKKLCIFDLDGTLTNTITAISYFGNTALSAIGLGPIDTEKYKIYVGDGRATLIHRMLGYYNADNEENYNIVCTEYDKCYEADPMYKTDAYDGIRELIAQLKSMGVKIAVCSNKPHNVVCDVVKTVFGDIFDTVKGIEDGDKVKPEPDNALKIVNDLGVLKSETLFIGDTNVDMFTAANAGIKSIGVLWGFRDKAELMSAGAKYIISKPSEIIKIVTED